MQSSYTPDFISFSLNTMKEQGKTIEKWAETAENPLVRRICGHILEAAKFAQAQHAT